MGRNVFVKKFRESFPELVMIKLKFEGLVEAK